ncbi:pyridoxal-phosphate dependent enzyme [Halobacillus sp. BBL2006]|uniref:pyridoxal-phosphate dependent enzyme n=1 Tax=Halobacillus sp. BBL2006 TaxID=1543706 RepID=UPI000542F3C6|nr:pyridoxal-phosphate dependent enzyme [Halobacillus sp. BBL2006]KHE72567.1 threonine dehydratase [Halobacillus sp. BBL2006]
MRDGSFSFRDVWKAKQRLNSMVETTPLIYSEALSGKLNSHVYLKLEHLHPTGSFKLRGAANKIMSLSEHEREKGVATFSTGNHGIAVAYVAKRLNIPCVVCISNRVPLEKVNRLKRLEARVEVVGSNQDDAEAYCYQLEKDEGMSVVKPFDDLEVIAGQGTIGLEIMEQLPEVGEVIVPLSGGGLLSGVGFSLKSIDSSVQITGVSMEKSAVMYESLKQGKPITLQEEDTLADSLLGGLGPDNQYTFAMTGEYMDGAELVSEQAIADGILYLLEHHKMAVEGAAASGVGLLLDKGRRAHDNIVVIISGNNIDHQTIEQLMNKR